MSGRTRKLLFFTARRYASEGSRDAASASRGGDQSDDTSDVSAWVQSRHISLSKVVSKVTGYSSSQIALPHRYGNSRAIWDHTVLPATRQRSHSRLYPSQLRLVLDLATPEGCKAKLT